MFGLFAACAENVPAMTSPKLSVFIGFIRSIVLLLGICFLSEVVVSIVLRGERGLSGLRQVVNKVAILLPEFFNGFAS